MRFLYSEDWVRSFENRAETASKSDGVLNPNLFA